MDHPYYTVSVANLSRGWSYEAVEGVSPDPDDDVILAAPLTYTWSFASGQVPGQIEPAAAAVNLAGKSASVLPVVEVGDLITIDVRVGTTGPRIIAPPPFRAVESTVTLLRGTFPARLSIPLTDLSVDWRALPVGPPVGQPVSNPGGDQRSARPYWRERGAEIAVVSGISIGCPTWWADAEDVASTLTDSGGRPFSGLAYFGFGAKPYEGDLPEVLRRFINSHQPDGLTHTWVTVYDPAGHPFGYRRIGPDTWRDGTDSAVPVGVLFEPNTPVRIEAVPATRKLASAEGLPLTLEVVDEVLTIVARAPGPGTNYATQVGLDADWCVLPATARRARESVANLVRLSGYGYQPDGTTDTDGVALRSVAEYARDFANTGDIATRGMLAREVPTMLALGESDTGDFYTGAPAAALVAENFLSDPSALSASWSYDAFTVYSSLIPQDTADWLLPIMAPRLPDEVDGDGILVRNVTIFDIEPRIRFGGQPVCGFITSGQMTIQGGEIEWTLSTAPGQPVRDGGTPEPITVGEFVDAAGSLTFADVDPGITFAELRHVQAP